MTTAKIEQWVGRTRLMGVTAALVYSLLALGAGAVVFCLTFCFVYGIVAFLTRMMLSKRGSVERWSLGITFVLSVLGCIDNFRASRDQLYPPGRWLLRECFYIGPRLILSGFRSLMRIFRLVGMDVTTCAKVLEHLAAKDKSVARDELLTALPELVWEKLISQLVLINGVLFFRTDFSRITLTATLRQRLRSLLDQETTTIPQEPKVAAEPRPVTDPSRLSYYEILGVPASATLEQIKVAYHAKIKECHPDRFSGMDTNTQRLAEEWSKALNLAYKSVIVERETAKTHQGK